jgi:hypothetical protein
MWGILILENESLPVRRGRNELVISAVGVCVKS